MPVDVTYGGISCAAQRRSFVLALRELLILPEVFIGLLAGRESCQFSLLVKEEGLFLKKVWSE